MTTYLRTLRALALIAALGAGCDQPTAGVPGANPGEPILAYPPASPPPAPVAEASIDLPAAPVALRGAEAARAAALAEAARLAEAADPDRGPSALGAGPVKQLSMPPRSAAPPPLSDTSRLLAAREAARARSLASTVASFTPGAVVIPMDLDFQDSGMFSAFGLVYELLRNHVPVHWAIKPGKAYGDVDFWLGRATDHRTGATVLDHGYRGGPFVVEAAHQGQALAIVDAWQAGRPATAVHVADEPFDAPIERTLVVAPTIAMFADGNQKVARSYMLAAGIPDSVGDPAWPDFSPDMLSPAETSGPTTTNHQDGQLFDGDGDPVYCQFMSMHWGVSDAQGTPEVVAEVRQFLGHPTHFFAECQAVNAFENVVPYGHFLTPYGMDIDNVGSGKGLADLLLLSQDSPYAQLDGEFETVGGSETGYSPCTAPPPASCDPGGSYKDSGVIMMSLAASGPGRNDLWMTGYLDGACPPQDDFCDPSGSGVSLGKISYLGGHQYETTVPISSNPDSQGTRLFLQALLEAQCATDAGQPTVEVFLSGPAATAAPQATWQVDVGSLGPTTVLDAVLTVTLPAGVTLVSASGAPAVSGQTLAWPLGNLGVLEGSARTVTVAFGAPGTYEVHAALAYRVGMNSFSMAAAPLSTEYGPDTDGDGVIDSRDNCPSVANPLQDLQTDVGSCGACGAVCAPDHATPSCVAGACLVGACAAGWADCNGVPADGCEYDAAGFLIDGSNCGACGAVCSAPNGTVGCVGGACEMVACPDGLADCNGDPADGCEYDTAGFDADVAHCGACGVACAYAHAAPDCASGSCAMGACEPGWLDCNGDPADGCELAEGELLTNPFHCGACNAACSLPNAAQACEAGACAVAACADGWADCNGDPADGCEYATGDFEDDPANCGACGHTCDVANGTATCSGGACVVGTCSPGFHDCNRDGSDGCERTDADLLSDADHCGACGVVCDDPVRKRQCVAGTCEDVPCPPDYLPESCGTGICQAFETCAGGYVRKCVANAPTMVDEVGNCDGRDNDCDGQTDEGYDDGIACTVSTCVDGVAHDVPDDAPCADTNPCTDDWCHPLFGCVNFPDNTNTPDPAYADDNPCTDLVCAFGASLNVPDDTNVPDDGLFCTVDTCANGGELHTQAASTCFVDGVCYAPGDVGSGDGCGVCHPAFAVDALDQTVWTETFDDLSISDWTVVDLTGAGITWRVDTARSVSPTASLYFGNPSKRNYVVSGKRVHAYAQTPPIALPAGTVSLLKFRAFVDTERYTAALTKDILRVELVDGGGTVHTLWDSTRAFGGTTWGHFYPAYLDVGTWAGQTVRLRFRFDSYDAYDNAFEGVYIDDIVIQTACCNTSSDCDDGDDCTVDYCADGGCRYLDTCSCTPNRPNLLVVLDFSGSMKYPAEIGETMTKWDAAVQAIDTALAIYGPLLNTGLKLFRTPGYGSSCSVSSSALEQPFGSTRAEIGGYLAGLTPSGSTPMGAGLVGARAVFANDPSLTGEQYVLLITDGAETCGGDPVAAIEGLKSDGVGTYVLGFGDGVDEAVLSAAALAGGHSRPLLYPGDKPYWSASNASAIDAALASIFAELASERCNGVDDDCDGLTDEDTPVYGCSVVCDGDVLPGVELCNGGTYDTCIADASSELCNGLDDNCNGLVDEAWTDGGPKSLGNECRAGKGACERFGHWVCPPSGTGAVVCDAVPGTPTPETCDGIDNDCDGVIDEKLTRSCVAGCNAGTETCFGGAWVLCTAVPDPDTQCDGIDNDCDGVTDPLFPQVGDPCDGADTDFCANGTWSCGLDAASIACVNEDPTDIPEVCGGLDEDCDGWTDEENAVGCTLYYRDADGDGFGGDPPRCLCAPQWPHVNPVGGDCDDARPDVFPGAVEVCDAVDQDCDGYTDEDPVVPTDPMRRICYTGPPETRWVGVCKDGIETCVAGAWAGCVGEVTPIPEECGGGDQDCDGTGDTYEPRPTETEADHPCRNEPHCQYADCYCLEHPQTNAWECVLE